MPPKQNVWNLVLFLVLSSLIFVGWSYLQHRLWPPPPPRPRPPVTWQVSPRQWTELLASTSGLAAMPTAAEIGTLGRLSTELAVALEQPRLALAQQQEQKPPPPKEPVKPRLPPGKQEEITLGGDGFNLRVELTTQLAGVKRVTLTQFKSANSMGRPVDTALPLIPGTHGLSNVVEYFANPNDEKPQAILDETQPWIIAQKTEPGADHQEVTFQADLPGVPVRVLKTYSLNRNDYHIGLAVKFQPLGDVASPFKLRYRLTGAHGLPLEGVWYTTIYRNALIGSEDNAHHLWRDYQDARTMPLTGGRKVPKGESLLRYAGVAAQYFASVIVVDNEQEKQNFVTEAQPVVIPPPRDIGIDADDNLVEVPDLLGRNHRPYLNDISVHVDSELELKPGQAVVHKYLLYNGPVKVQLLGDLGAGGNAVPAEVLDRYLNRLHLNTLTDYQSPGWAGSFSGAIGWSYLLIKVTNFMHGILGGLYSLIPNYGVCIILLTLLVRGLMHPVSRKQARTSIRMQALVPELKKLQEKHKNDRQALAMAQMELYRKHGVSPMGSCWVVLLQMPIFMGLYYALQESIHFRLAPFLWIKNLAAPDMLFYWGQGIPWISRPEDLGNFFYLGPYLNLLPVFAVTLMIIQQKFLMPPATDEAQEMQQKMMKYMSIFFGLLFYKVAAGLCIYFIVSSLWGLTERQLLPKAKPVGATPAGEGGTPARTLATRSKPRGPKADQADGTFKRVQEMWSELLKQAKKK